MPANAAERTIATIQAEIGLARILYNAVVSHSIAMAATENAAYLAYDPTDNYAHNNIGLAYTADRKNACGNGYSAFFDAWCVAALARSEVDRIAEVLQTLSVELAALRDR